MPNEIIPALTEFSLRIDKVSVNKATGAMQWSCVASDTDYDSYHQRMSLELFRDFIIRAQSNIKPPAEFCSEAWAGGNPYLSVSHYYDLGGDGIAGDTKAVYIDGNRLKAKGTFRSTALGLAAFQAICADLYGEVRRADKIRISIGFLDWSHSHGSYVFERKSVWDQCPMCRESRDDIVFLKGQLIHLAMTRVPVNRRTDIEPVVEERSMTTKKEDAASIVGEELADQLEQKEKAMVGKSEAFVEKSEEELPAEDSSGEAETEQATIEESNPAEVAVSPVENKGDYRPLGGAKTFEELESYQAAQEQAQMLQDSWYALQAMMYNIMDDEACVDKKKMMEKAITGFKGKLEMKAMIALSKLAEQPEIVAKSEPATPAPAHVLDSAIATLKSAYDAALSQPDPLVVLQADFNTFAESIRDSIPAQPVVIEQAATEPAAELTALVDEFKKALQPLTQSVQLLSQQLSATQGAKTVTASMPQRRSVPATQLQSTAAPEKSGSQIDQLARRSVGIL